MASATTPTGQDEPDLYEPRHPGRRVRMPRITVHQSPQSGRVTAIADLGLRSEDLSAQLALLLPAGLRLVDAVGNGGCAVLTFMPQDSNEVPA